MTAWLFRLMPQYVADRFDAYAWWLLSSLSWVAVFIFATKNMELSASSQAAFGIAASTLGALGAIDIAVHRLPRQISYVSLSLIGVFLVVGSASRSVQSADLVAGMALMFIVIGALRIVVGAAVTLPVLAGDAAIAGISSFNTNALTKYFFEFKAK